MDIKKLSKVMDSFGDDLADYFKSNTTYKVISRPVEVILTNGAPENYSFKIILDGNRIGKVSPRRGATTVKERQEVRRLSDEWNAQVKESKSVPQSEIDEFFTNLDKAYREALDEREKLQHIVAYRHLNINVIERRDGFDWSVSLLGSDDMEQGHSNSYNELISDLQKAIDKVNV